MASEMDAGRGDLKPVVSPSTAQEKLSRAVGCHTRTRSKHGARQQTSCRELSGLCIAFRVELHAGLLIEPSPSSLPTHL